MNSIHNNFKSAIHSDLVTFVRRGYEKIYHQIHPISGSKKMAFTLDLVNYVVEAMKNVDKKEPNSWTIRAREIALRIGIYFLLRKSEYLPNANGSQPELRRSNLLFFNSQGYPILCSLIQKGQASSARIVIPYSKCDQFGKGRNILHVKQDKSRRCIVNDLEEWVILTRQELRATDSDFLFCVKGRVLISSDQVTTI